MAAILKYQLKIEDRQTIKLPANARLLSVKDQMGVLCLWAFVNPPGNPLERVIRIVGTGHELPADFLKHHDFIGTVVQDEIGGVWHVFEELTP